MKNKDLYKQILFDSSFGFAYHNVILDDGGNPQDYRFKEVNAAFAKLTGLSAEAIRGKTVKQLFPQIDSCGFDWINVYGQVTKTGKSISFESYFEPLALWFKVEASSPQFGEFATVFTDISDLKSNELLALNQAKQNRKEGEERIDELIESMPDMIFVMHRNGTILHIHGADQEKLIAPAEELIGTSIKECFSENEFKRHIELYNHCIVHKVNSLIEFELLIDNRPAYFESRIKPLDNERLLTIVRDITDRKMSEQMILKHQKDLIEINRIGFIANSFLELNKLLDSVLQSVVKALGAQVGMIFLRDSDLDQLLWGASHGLSDGFYHDFQNNPIRIGEGLTGTIAKTGKPIYISQNSSCDPRVERSVIIQEDLNSFIGVPIFAGDAVVGVMNILTRAPELLSENHLHTCTAIGSQIGLAIRNARLFDKQNRIQHSLKESESRYRTYVDNAPLGIFVADQNGFYLEVNQEACRVTGYTREELIGMQIFQIVAPESMNHAEAHFKKLIDKGRAVQDVLGVCKTGEKRWWRVMAARINKERFLGFHEDITERVLIEEQLHNTQAHLLAVFENTFDSIWSINRNYEITYINDEFEKAFKAYFNVILKPGSNVLDSLPQSMRQIWKKHYDNALDGAREIFEETVTGNNRIIYIEVSASPIIQHGVITGASFFGRDITERKLAEEILAKQKQYLETIIQTTVDGFWAVSLQGEIRQVNQAYCQMSGYACDELLKMNIWDIDAVESPSETKEHIRGIIQNGSEVFETKHKRKDGSIFDVGLSVTYLEIEGGLIVCFCRDITERKAAADALLQSNQRLEAFLEIGRNITKILDRDKIMQMIVENASKVINVGSGAIYLKNKDEAVQLAATYPALPDEFHDAGLIAFLSDHPHIELAMQTGNHVIMDDSQRASLTAAELQIVQVRNLRSAIYLPIQIKGNTIGILILSSVEEIHHFTDEEIRMLLGFADQAAHIIENAGYYSDLKRHAAELESQIDQRKKAEEKLLLAKERAEESDRLKSAFLMNISHEIRTPMNGILGFSSLLGQTGLSDQSKSDYIRIINESGDRLMDTINDIVEISKIEIGDIVVEFADVKLSDLMQYYFDFFELQAKNKGLDLYMTKNVTGETAFIRTDKHKIDGIMMNLIKNAVKFTHQGKIEFGNYIEEGKLVFFVSDTGIGIPEHKCQLVFDRFIQANMNLTSGYEGSGIGLSIAKAYTEALNGTITVDSQVGIGSNFYVSIPYFPQKNEIKQNSNPVSNQSSKLLHKVVVAEDDDINYLFIETVLSEEFTVLRATSGAQAIDLLRRNEEDVLVILMDLKMPGDLDGFEAIKIIREKNQQVPIVAQTAFGYDVDKNRAEEAGCNYYLSKPFTAKELKSIVKSYL